MTFTLIRSEWKVEVFETSITTSIALFTSFMQGTTSN